MRARLVLTTIPLAIVGLVVGTSSAAAPEKTSYAVTAPIPDASNLCDGTIPMSSQADDFKVKGAGTVEIVLSGFQGDWDLYARVGGSDVGSSAGFNPVDGVTETIVLKLKKATTVSVVACNFAGGPTGQVDITYTAKA